MTARPWFRIAAQALQSALDDDWEAAAAAIRRIDAEHGTEGMVSSMLAWVDTMANLVGLHRDGQAITFVFLHSDTGDVTGVDQVPWDTAWAGRFITARLANDPETAQALLGSLPDAAAYSAVVCALLSCVAQTIRNGDAIHTGRLPGGGTP